MPRIRVFDTAQRLSDRCTLMVSKSTAQKWVAAENYEWVESKAIRKLSVSQRIALQSARKPVERPIPVWDTWPREIGPEGILRVIPINQW